jgi:hypothetical protein
MSRLSQMSPLPHSHFDMRSLCNTFVLIAMAAGHEAVVGDHGASAAGGRQAGMTAARRVTVKVATSGNTLAKLSMASVSDARCMLTALCKAHSTSQLMPA